MQKPRAGRIKIYTDSCTAKVRPAADDLGIHLSYRDSKETVQWNTV